MSPKRTAIRQGTSKTVTIYNSAGKRDRKMAGNAYEQTRNSAENWEFHFKMADIETIKGIIKTKNINGVPLIIGAAVLNQKETLQTLLKHGYNINETDKNNLTPLVWAVKLKHLDMIQSLLENNADSSIRPQNGDDLACIALSSSFWDEQSFLTLFNYLKKFNSVDVNAINKNGLSLLHLAVRREWNSLVDVLIQNESNVNIATTNGVTPLMLASYRNDFTIVTRLLNRGAAVKRRNTDGFTALCYAFSSVITKELQPPFLVVDKLQIELAKLKIDLSIYLKERVKLMLNFSKNRPNDQPSPEQMMSHICIFILKNVENGFELMAEVQIGKAIKQAMEKFLDDKINLKLPLVVMNVILKHLSFTQNVENLVLKEFIDGECFDLCLKVMRLYEEDPILLQLAVTPIIIFSGSYAVAQRWYEVIKRDISRYISKYEDCMHLIDGTPEQIAFIRERLVDFKCNICNIQHTDLPELVVITSDKDVKPVPCSKKAKRRTKALKAKLSKIKTSELTVRFNSIPIVTSQQKLVEVERTNLVCDMTSEEEILCANAIKMAVSLLDEDSASETSVVSPASGSRRGYKDLFKTSITHTNDACGTSKMAENNDNRPKDTNENSWQNKIRNLPFQNTKIYKSPMSPNDFNPLQCNLQNGDVDAIIKYLENILATILARYKAAWDFDIGADVSENEYEWFLPCVETEIEAIHSLEKEQLRLVYREFHTLTRNVKDSYDNNPDACMKILRDLERYLLTYPVRGVTVVDSVAPLELVKVNVTMPVDFEEKLIPYMSSVLAGEIEEDPEVQIKFKEHLTPNTELNSMGDYAYLNEMNSHLVTHSQPSQSIAHASTHSNIHGYTNSSSQRMLSVAGSSTYSHWDTDDDVESLTNNPILAQCCFKGCHAIDYSDQDKSSKWCAILRNLEVEEGQVFLNGSIRLSNMQKRKSHCLSLNGNFVGMEVGLTADNKPIAVKIMSKSDPCAILLKSQVDPLLKLKHKYILPYHTCKYDNNLLLLATPLCEYNLGQYVLKMRQPQSLICKVNVIRQLLHGLMYLHNQEEPIVHGNLKPSNILIDINGTVKVAEFGIYKAKLKVKNLPESTIIWFATELYSMYKSGSPLTCTCASDIQVAGMLVHFTNNGGAHPFGRTVPDILAHLLDGTVEMINNDMELYDMLSWMLMNDPADRPTINQVMSHIFFWSSQKKWTYVLTCSGYGIMNTSPLDVETLHSSLDKIAEKENISGNCWVTTVKKQYPEISLADASDTPSGLLRFIKDVVENKLALSTTSEKDLCLKDFILNTFPHFVLALYRMIENSEWSDHKVFMPFHNSIV